MWRFVAGTGTFVLKIYAPDIANPLFGNHPEREAIALKSLAGSRLSPRMFAAGQRGGVYWLIYAHVPGQSWNRQPERVARMLGDLHERPTPAGLPNGMNGTMDLANQTEAMLRSCGGPLAARLSALRPSGTAGPVARPVLIHGDPVPGNILVHGDDVVLIDWQCPSIGDPTEDIAVFLSPAMQQIYRGKPLSQFEVSSFLAAYPHRATVLRYLTLRPWFHWRMAAYCLWQTRRGETDYAPGLELELQALSAQSSAMKSARPTET